jgi:hypothetical protein
LRTGEIAQEILKWIATLTGSWRSVRRRRGCPAARRGATTAELAQKILETANTRRIPRTALRRRRSTAGTAEQLSQNIPETAATGAGLGGSRRGTLHHHLE